MLAEYSFSSSSDNRSHPEHFKTTVLEGGILLAGFDYCGKPVNVLNDDSLAGWEKVVQRALETDAIVGVVLLSMKEGNFCAGADLEQIRLAQESRIFDGVDRLVATVHKLFDMMERSTKPFVAALEGTCLGGGLELALACHARIASAHPRTCFGLPEVKLGIIPGFGGTQRLPRLVGLPAALEMITSGKTILPRQALRMGLIDGMVPSVPSRLRTLDEVQRETLVEAAIAKVHALRSASAAKRTLPIGQRCLSLPGVRSVLYRYVRRRVARRIRHFYPAPLCAIDAVERGTRHSVLEGSRDVEKPILLDLMASEVSAYLVGLFLGSETVKRSVTSAVLSTVRVGVLGAGLMGSQIAAQLAEKGCTVVLRDISPHALAQAMGRIYKSQSVQLQRRKILPSEVRARMLRLAPTLRTGDLGALPLVIEAVSETLPVKRSVLAEFESVAGPDAIFATNTSSYTVGAIAEGSRHPERCVGLHFFNPVAKMQLVEVVRAPFTSAAAVLHACGLAKLLGKIPLVVNDGPGFLVNRILGRYLAEAVILLSEGVAIARVDAVAKAFGMAVDSGRAMGPLELLDLIGLEVARHVLTSLSTLGPRIECRDGLLEALLPAGKPPVKFWKSGRENPQAVEAIGEYRRLVQDDADSFSDDVIRNRLFLPMVDEAIRCLHDRIVDQAWKVDLALIHGIGFPAFRGGLLAWARKVMTASRIAEELDSLAARYGKRFEPCAYLTQETW